MARTGATRIIGLLATVVRVVASVVAALIVAHAVFVFFEANPANPLVEFTTDVRDTFGWFTKDLFQPSDAKVGETINDALAALIAEEGTDTGASPETAEALLQGIATELGIEADMVTPAFEDPAEWILKEADLPANVTPQNSKLKDPEERHRIAKVFDRGLTTPSGYILPVQRWQSKAGGARWRSERWKLRRGFLYLVPGDSPVGFRLPLGKLPWISASNYPYTNIVDPTVVRVLAVLAYLDLAD